MIGSLTTPRVFISYSWSSPQHELWVIDLAQRLMGDGIDVIVDKWNLKEGQDKHAFMERMVNDTQIAKVLVICDRQYQSKANTRKGGVGTESQLISKEVYDNTEQEKFIPIVKEYFEDKPCIPSFMGSRIYINLSNEEHFEEEYEKLIRNLYGKPEIKKPPLGGAPAYIQDNDDHPSKAVQQMQKMRLESHIGKVGIPSGGLTDFLESMYVDLDQHRLPRNNRPEFDDEIIGSIGKLIKLRDVFIDFITRIYRTQETVDPDILKSFFERLLCLFNPPDVSIPSSNFDYDNFKFFIYELILYYLSILIKERKFDDASYFINSNYFYYDNGGTKHGRIWLFNRSATRLDDIRNQRLHLNRVSIMSDLIKERAKRKDISFEILKQTDLTIYIITSLNSSDEYFWYPRTSVYNSRYGGHGIEIFEKMISASHFNKTKILLKINTKEELMKKIDKYEMDVQEGKKHTIGSFSYNVPEMRSLFDLNYLTSID